MNLIEAIQSVNMEETIDRMNAYAIFRLKSVGAKSFNGKEPVDFVGDLLLKVMEGTRDWNKAQCTFPVFLFGCLRSDIDSFFKTNKVKHISTIPEIPLGSETSKIDDQRKKVTELLIQAGADVDEQVVFEYWMDGTKKPAEIAKDLGVDVKEVNNITKRLVRRLPKIQSQLVNVL